MVSMSWVNPITFRSGNEKDCSEADGLDECFLSLNGLLVCFCVLMISACDFIELKKSSSS